MDQGFGEVKGMVGSVLKIVKNIERRIGEVHTVARVDVPEMREKIERLEKRMERIEKKVGV